MATALQQRLLTLTACGIGSPQDVADLAAADAGSRSARARSTGGRCSPRARDFYVAPAGASLWLLLNLAKYFYPAVSFKPPQAHGFEPLPADLAGVAATLTLGNLEERLELLRQLKLQVRNGPLHFVLELLGQRRRLADVL